jgi:hypothetical protein
MSYFLAAFLILCGLSALIVLALITSRPNPPRCKRCGGRMILSYYDGEGLVCTNCQLP